MSNKLIADSVDHLIQAYYDSGLRLIELIRSLDQGISKRRKEQILLQVDAIINQLTQNAANSTAQLLALTYKQGVLEAVTSMSTQGLQEINASLQPLIHQQAVQAIMDESFYNILEASNNMSNDVKKRIEGVVRNANQRSLVEGVSRKQATKNAIAELTQNQITGIVTANGSRVPIDKYMKGVIQYNQRKAHVVGTENTITQNGIDLLYVNYVGITCEYCAQYQGRVYSISGKDPRFPKLEKRPPYHAHCVHSVSAFVEEYQQTDEVDRMLEVSNQPFKDTRTKANIARYENRQRLTSRKNATMKQWIRYKAVLPDTPDLKQFASQKTRNTKPFQELQADYRKVNAEIKGEG